MLILIFSVRFIAVVVGVDVGEESESVLVVGCLTRQVFCEDLYSLPWAVSGGGSAS